MVPETPTLTLSRGVQVSAGEVQAWYEALQAWHSLIAVDWHGAHHGWLLRVHEWQGRALAWHKKQPYVPGPNPPARGWWLGRPPLFENLGVWRKALQGWYYTALAWHKAYFRWLGTARGWYGRALAWTEIRNYPLVPSSTPGGVVFVEPPAPPEGLDFETAPEDPRRLAAWGEGVQ